jgi:superfamily II DNA or RNA helicase
MTEIDSTCGLLILDEVHRYAKEESEYFSKVLELTKYNHLLCLSATLDKEEKQFLESFNIKRVGYVSIEEAEANKWISQFIIYNYGVELDDEDREYQTNISKLFNQYYAKFDFDYEYLTYSYAY